MLWAQQASHVENLTFFLVLASRSTLYHTGALRLCQQQMCPQQQQQQQRCRPRLIACAGPGNPPAVPCRSSSFGAVASPVYRAAPPCSTDRRGACAVSMYALIFSASRRATSARPRALALVAFGAGGGAPALSWALGVLG